MVGEKEQPESSHHYKNQNNDGDREVLSIGDRGEDKESGPHEKRQSDISTVSAEARAEKDMRGRREIRTERQKGNKPRPRSSS